MSLKVCEFCIVREKVIPYVQMWYHFFARNTQVSQTSQDTHFTIFCNQSSQFCLI